MFSPQELDRFRPRNFGGLRHLRYAEFDANFFMPIAPQTGARAEGMRYERRVHTAFSAFFSPERGSILYAPAMWIRYFDGSHRKFAQPDGLILDLKRSFITIIEIKLKHTISAYYWLRELYEPLIRHIFGTSWKYAVCEVVKWFDGSLLWPEPLRMIADPSALGVNEFGLHIWKR